jgi:hypothetical protein
VDNQGAPARTLKQLKLSSNSVKGGLSVTATITLDQPAFAGGQEVNIDTSNTGLTVLPGSPITIPAGDLSYQFTIQTRHVSAPTPVEIVAAGLPGGNVLNTQLMLTP